MVVDLEIEQLDNGNSVVVVAKGEIDVYTAPRLRDRLTELIDSGVTQIEVDLSAIDFLDSTGLGVLVGAMKRLDESGGALSVVCDKAHIVKVFEITGLTSLLNVSGHTEGAG